MESFYKKSEIPDGLQQYFEPAEIGLEKTPDEFVAAMVEVFSIVWELLADDGVLWLNLGDSYNAAGRTGHGTKQGVKQGTNRASASKADVCRPSVATLKPKDLIGIPWKVAFALQASGWYLRQDIIWAKPNPMPESVTDRCTKSHEYLFLLTKNERYYFDQEAIKEPVTDSTTARMRQDVGSQAGSARVPGKTNGTMKAVGGSETRNKRSVWTVTTTPFKGAHFAVFPSALVEPCVLAGSRPGDIVLDPFLGSGTTGEVAQRLGRQWIGCELNRDYESLQKHRTAQSALAL